MKTETLYQGKTDEDVARAAQRTEDRAFDELVRRYQGQILSFLAHKTRNRQLAEDLAQEVFFQVFKNLHKFDDAKGTFHAWVYFIALNRSKNAHRNRQRNPVHSFSSLNKHDIDMADLSPLPDTLLERKEETEMMELVSRDFDLKWKTVLELRTEQEMMYEEIAIVLNVPVGTIKSRLHRAKTELKNRLSS